MGALRVPPPTDEELIKQYKALNEAVTKFYKSGKHVGTILLNGTDNKNPTIQLPIEKSKGNSAYLSLRDAFRVPDLFLMPDSFKRKLKQQVITAHPELCLHDLKNASLIVSRKSRGQPIHIDAQVQRHGPNEKMFLLYLSSGLPGTTYFRLNRVQNIESAEDLQRIWPDMPGDLVSRIKGIPAAEKVIQEYGAVFLASLGERIETEKVDQFSMMGLNGGQPHCGPSTLHSEKVRAVVFFTMTPPDFDGEEYNSETQMSREKLCLALRAAVKPPQNARTDECCQYLFDKFIQYTGESAVNGARDDTVDFGENKELLKQVESLVQNIGAKKHIEKEIRKNQHVRKKRRY